MNSVDKYPGDDGDYITSMRHMSAIYRVSRATGEVVWRLGGKRSDFLQDFEFAGQHDARVVYLDPTVTIISLFDNAAVSGEFNDIRNISSFKLVALYETETPKRAVVSQPTVTHHFTSQC